MCHREGADTVGGYKAKTPLQDRQGKFPNSIGPTNAFSGTLHSITCLTQCKISSCFNERFLLDFTFLGEILLNVPYLKCRCLYSLEYIFHYYFLYFYWVLQSTSIR